ncbi:NYN domain-containing protein [Massilia sp. TWP1-3-3]|uniref:NYN domain-containing protein n=1 Tax=Massilia sp. TWP1-3-3 TaxID=2804573 RepID=UPI003CFADAD0
MASSNDNISMAVFCDFENVALGVRDANYEKFDIKPVLERLLLKGSIVVKKAYCDWERYKGFKATMHEANFELIEIPHVRQSGKNSADIRLVVDALDLCYTKSHVNTFVIISGDSDFSPLVSKLRENAKQVIGVGVKQSTSDLLVANCDEFIFYDDLVREVKRAAAKRDERKKPEARRPAVAGTSDEAIRRKEELEERKAKAIELVVEMFDALVSERGDSGKIWASLLKDTLKRRRPDFNETYYGFRTFGNLLEEAQNRGMLEFGRDEKSGAYVYRSSNPPALNAAAGEPATEQAGEQDSALVEVQEPREARPAREVQEPREARPPREGRAPREPRAPRERQQQAPQSDARRRGGRGYRSEAVVNDQAPPAQDSEAIDPIELQPPMPKPQGKGDARRGAGRGGRNGRKGADVYEPVPNQAELERQMHLAQGDDEDEHESVAEVIQVAPEPAPELVPEPVQEKRRSTRGARKSAVSKVDAALMAEEPVAEEPVAEARVEDAPEAAEAAVEAEAPKKAARKPAARPRKPAKPKAEAE